MTEFIQGKVAFDGLAYDVIALIDEDAEVTNIAEEACVLLLQLPEDKRPAGTEQIYKTVRIKKGSFKPIPKH